MFAMISHLQARFQRDEDGLALTEYLVLLGLLIGGIVVAVTAFGDGLDVAWTSWTNFFSNANLAYVNQ